MLVRVIKSYRDVVVICDSNLLGQKFEEEKFQLDIKESFFKGEETKKEKAIELIKIMMKEDATFNIVGEKSINTALEAGLITKESIKKIQGIPFTIVLI